VSLPIRASTSARGAMSRFMPSTSATPLAIWRSVWKLPLSESNVLRSDRRAAATSNLNRFTEVESVTITSWGLAPISGASLAPTRCGALIQSAVFQLRISPSAHSFSTTSRWCGATALGKGPSELPSR